jgi:hypothetical protein
MRPSRHNESHLGWHGRGYLPHFDGGELAQFITFRLHDSLPREVLIRWIEELKLQPSAEVQSLMRKRVEVYLDQGHGSVTCGIMRSLKWFTTRFSFTIKSNTA